MLYLFHGENDLEREEAVAAAIQASGLQPEYREFNTEVLSAPVTPAAVARACRTIPFLGDVRVVIARNALGGDGKVEQKVLREMADVLSDMPSSTCMVFVDDKALAAKNPVLEQAKQLKAQVRVFALPKDKELPGWILARVRMHGGTIEAPAAALLAQNLGAALRVLDQELQKLLLYCGERKTITVEDVRVMVPYVQSADVIFDLVDALGKRKPGDAARYLHRMLDVGEHPLGIFAMIVRQFRLLVQARWLLDQGAASADIAGALKVHPFVAQKLGDQANYFTFEQLSAAYRSLLESDLAIKTGQVTGEAALDLLVAELTRL